MVGLVLVSHSRALADAATDLVRRTVGSELPIAAAGGVGEGRAELGTDALDIQSAIQGLRTTDGVLVLMDMGSAVLSAETALDLFDSRPAVRLCAAPLVEGAVAAGIQAQAGSSLETVTEAARRSLEPKEEQLNGERIDAAGPAPLRVPDRPEEVLEVEITNPHGLHLRPVSRLLAVLSALDVQVTLENATMGGGRVQADSLVEISRLQLRRGHLARFTVSGRDAAKALAQIRELAERRFGDDASTQIAARSSAGTAGPVPIAAGTALGRPFVVEGVRRMVSEAAVPEEDVSVQLAVLADALDGAVALLQARAEAAGERAASENLASLLWTQRLILEDRSIRERARKLIREQRHSAAAAWLEVTDEVARHQAAAADPYLRQRAADFRDAGELVLQRMPGFAGATASPVLPDHPFILVCEELSPSMFDQVRSPYLQGIIQFAGGPNAHGAILARSAGIPCLGTARLHADRLRTAGFLAFDGRTGELWFDPPPDVTADLRERQVRETRVRASRSVRAKETAVTRDGIGVTVQANVGTAAEVEKAALAGAEGIGLFRTEILFQEFAAEPGEDAQLALWSEALASWDDRPVTVRLLDIGGDKPLSFLSGPPEANPFLGVRGIRLLLQHRGFLGSHLRALLRLAHRRNVNLLVPMVTDGHELRIVAGELARAHENLVSRGADHRWPVTAGAMVETPSSAVLLASLAANVPLFSIGTNDLTQYVLAAERGHPSLREYQDGLHPALVRVLHRVATEGAAAGVPVSVCGELAADPEAIPILVGAGLTSLSVAPGSVPMVKEAVRQLSRGDCQRALETLLNESLTRGEEVRAFVRQHFPELVLGEQDG
ncbi:MAG TPA: phosphoenolpyruvate--protein phosphotransferase [Chthoniobacterales bacterium]